MSLTFAQTRNDLLSKLGYEDYTLAPALALQDCVVAINGALQMLQTAGQDYFTREKLTTAFGIGVGMVALAKTIQTVIGPVRWNDIKPLRALASRGELDQYDRIYLGSSSYGAAAGTPQAYWIENIKSGTTGDINQINLWLVPVPSVAGNLVSEIINDAAAYVVADLSGSGVIPVAQAYTESIFLPIARMLVTRSSQFSRPSILPGLTTDYQVAMQRLGYGGGFPNAVQPEPAREVSA